MEANEGEIEIILRQQLGCKRDPTAREEEGGKGSKNHSCSDNHLRWPLAQQKREMSSSMSIPCSLTSSQHESLRLGSTQPQPHSHVLPQRGIPPPPPPPPFSRGPVSTHKHTLASKGKQGGIQDHGQAHFFFHPWSTISQQLLQHATSRTATSDPSYREQLQDETVRLA